MCILDNALKRGIATTMFTAAATVGAIAGAILVGGTATVALIVASVALGVFTLISLLGTTAGGFEDMMANHSNPENPKAKVSRKSVDQTHSGNMLSILMICACSCCFASSKNKEVN